jgi:hypothetical protein
MNGDFPTAYTRVPNICAGGTSATFTHRNGCPVLTGAGGAQCTCVDDGRILKQHIWHQIVVERACISLLEARPRINGNLALIVLHEIEQHRYALQVLETLLGDAPAREDGDRTGHIAATTSRQPGYDSPANPEPLAHLRGRKSPPGDGWKDPSANPSAPLDLSNLPMLGRWDGTGPEPRRWIDDVGTIHYRSYEDYCFDGEDSLH